MYNAPSASYVASRSPPMEGFRGSPGPMASRSQFSGSSSSLLSPPPIPANGFSPVPSGQSARFPLAQQQAAYARSNPMRYGTPPAMGNGAPGYPQYPQMPQVPQQLPPAKHKGTLAPGQMIIVGQNQVRIERYLSEGGYAHVYLTTSDRPIYPPLKEEKKGRWGEKGYTQHCLKRIAFQDEAVWTDVKKEIEVMKSLPPNPHLTQYLGSAHSKLPSGGYEVFILMEFCAGGGIIDLLNKRLRDRLKEAEILNIFTDVCEAVAAMHALPRPLLHRDLKIENVLSQPTGSGSSASRPMGLIFKLCDFGSTTFPATHPPSSKLEADSLAIDLNKNTTLQYRSPEMVEPMLGQAVGLPSDVWALGVLLYKLCYYTTPFEEHGTLAIVNAKYTFPQYPVYSPHIQHLIASMLLEHPQRRPTVFEILKTAHDMSGTRSSIDYPTPSRGLTSASVAPRESVPSSRTSNNLLDFTSPSSPPPVMPSLQPNLASSIAPQRRGRPMRDTPQRDVIQPVPALPQPPRIVQPTQSAPEETVAAKIQVTGEGAKDTPAPQAAKPSPSPSGSIDAFGAPSKPSVKNDVGGFGESFSGRKPFIPTSKFGEQLQKEYSGFGDSFGAKKASASSSTSTRPSQLSPSSVPDGSSVSGPKITDSPPAMQPSQKPPPTRAEPDGEVSFETRFPSLEELDADHPTDEAPPSMRPSIRSQPSLIGNLTGGDLASPKVPVVRQDGMPQPRSTHVTGTAFKHSPEEGISIRERSEYFQQRQPESGKVGSESSATAPLDLLTGREDSMGEPLIAKQTDVAPPAADSTSAQQDKLVREPGRSSTMSSSSDEDEGPENASAAYKPISSPGEEKAESSVAPSANALKSRFQPPPTSAKPASLRHGSMDRTRPQSVYSASFRQQSDPAAIEAGPQSAGTPHTSERPTHGRKGSVTDITARFEQLHSPSGPSKLEVPVKSTSLGANGGLSQKPSIATKPVTLRKPSMDGGSVKQNVVTSPISPTVSSTVSKAVPPKTIAKPEALRRSSKFGDAPTPTAYGRTSSGRAFPIHRPAESADPPLQATNAPAPSAPSVREAEGSSEPAEERQSVNSLIARWNQGDVAKKTVPPKRGGLV